MAEEGENVKWMDRKRQQQEASEEGGQHWTMAVQCPTMRERRSVRLERADNLANVQARVGRGGGSCVRKAPAGKRGCD